MEDKEDRALELRRLEVANVDDTDCVGLEGLGVLSGLTDSETGLAAAAITEELTVKLILLGTARDNDVGLEEAVT